MLFARNFTTSRDPEQHYLRDLAREQTLHDLNSFLAVLILFKYIVEHLPG